MAERPWIGHSAKIQNVSGPYPLPLPRPLSITGQQHPSFNGVGRARVRWFGHAALPDLEGASPGKESSAGVAVNGLAGSGCASCSALVSVKSSDGDSSTVSRSVSAAIDFQLGKSPGKRTLVAASYRARFQKASRTSVRD